MTITTTPLGRPHRYGKRFFCSMLLAILFGIGVHAVAKQPSMHYWPNNHAQPDDRFSNAEEAGRALLDRTGNTNTSGVAYWTFDHVERIVIGAGSVHERGAWNIWYRYTNTVTGQYMTGPYTFDQVQEVFVCDPTPRWDGFPKDFSIYPKLSYPNGCPTPAVDPDKNLGPKKLPAHKSDQHRPGK